MLLDGQVLTEPQQMDITAECCSTSYKVQYYEATKLAVLRMAPGDVMVDPPEREKLPCSRGLALVRYGLPELKLGHVIYHVIASPWGTYDWPDYCRCGACAQIEPSALASVSWAQSSPPSPKSFEISTLFPLFSFLRPHFVSCLVWSGDRLAFSV